jgi:hypothetical protein
MKLIRLFVAASLFAGIAPNVVFADCNPPCKGNRVCRYDSTHNPPFFCRKPPAGAAVQQAPTPVNSSAPAKQRPQYQQGGSTGSGWQRKAAAPTRPVQP